MLDLIELIVNWFYTRKYGAMARRFGRGTAEDDGRRGLIILQIDGLSHATLQQAIGQGSMPHLKRMLDREGYSLQQWWCGLPSSTPAVQGGLMYGNNWNIPAFRWYEKQGGKTLVAKHPRDARILQDRLSAGRHGLLEGGSSYVNIYDGGARLSLFTVSALGGERFFENVRGVGFATLLLLSPLRLLRLIGDFGLCIPLQLSLLGRTDLWSGLSLHPRLDPLGCLPLSLYTFSDVAIRAWLGITPPGASPNLTGEPT